MALSPTSCKEECETPRKSAEAREHLSKAHRRALTISCIWKGKRTHMRIGNTRLLILLIFWPIYPNLSWQKYKAIFKLKLFFLAFYRNIRLFFALLLMDSSLLSNTTLILRIKNEALGSGLLEAFLESAPQFILQLFIILSTGQISKNFFT